MTGSEQVLIHGWCQQYMTHSIGDLAFGPGGALYASAGDGAHPDRVDYGQGGGSPGSPVPKNPCGDPPGGVGASLSPPSARGGSLRSQSLRRPVGEPRVLPGTIARVDPATGAGLPNNPLASSADANERRIVAGGLRNPFRFTLRPGPTSCGSATSATSTGRRSTACPRRPTPVKNFGWPCYEGDGPQSSWQATGLSICSSLYAQSGAVTAPFAKYFHPRRSRARAARSAARRSPASRSSRRGAAPTARSTTARCSSPTARASASGRCCAAARRCPTGPGRRPSCRGRQPGGPAGRPRRRPLLRRLRRGHRAAHPLHG